MSGLGMPSLPPKPEEFEHVVLVMRNEMTEAEWCLLRTTSVTGGVERDNLLGAYDGTWQPMCHNSTGSHYWWETVGHMVDSAIMVARHHATTESTTLSA